MLGISKDQNAFDDVPCVNQILEILTRIIQPGQYGIPNLWNISQSRRDESSILVVLQMLKQAIDQIAKHVQGEIVQFVVWQPRAEVPEELRRKWKVARDCSRRGYTTDEVLSELDRRELDAIDAQLTSTPGTLRYMPVPDQPVEREFEAIAAEVVEREFPLPALLGKSKAVAKLMADGLIALRQRGSRLLWRLAIWRCVRP
jgi:hypothetical protein